MPEATQIIALILCGGQSERMGRPKANLIYHQVPQYQYLLNLCGLLGLQTFISCNKNQLKLLDDISNVIIDKEQFKESGPISGLLSAIELFPQSAILLLGCDYPLVQAKDLAVLIQDFKDNQKTIGYYHSITKMFEPTISIYHPKEFEIIRNRFQNKQTSLRHFLEETMATKLIPADINILKSFDTMEDYLGFNAPPIV